MVFLLVLIVVQELTPPLLAVQNAQLALMVHMLLRLDQRAAWSVLQDHSPLASQRPAHPVMLGRTP